MAQSEQEMLLKQGVDVTLKHVSTERIEHELERRLRHLLPDLCAGGSSSKPDMEKMREELHVPKGGEGGGSTTVVGGLAVVLLAGAGAGIYMHSLPRGPGGRGGAGAEV